MGEVQCENIDLYHYTTLEGLMGIVNNRTIRLTDYRFLNDPVDLIYGLDKVDSELSKYEEEKVALHKQHIANIKEGIGERFVTLGQDSDGYYISQRQIDNSARYYVLSMTHQSDNLQMWQAYGKYGCRLKLNSQALFKFFYEFRDKYFFAGIRNIHRGDIDYGGELLSAKLDFIMKISNMFMAYDEVCALSALIKKADFKYEDEYRIFVYFYDKMFDGDTRKVFMLKEQTIVPQLEISNFPIEEILEDVIISPFNNSDCAELGLKEFLSYKLERDIPIAKSSIKFRQR